MRLGLLAVATMVMAGCSGDPASEIPDVAPETSAFCFQNRSSHSDQLSETYLMPYGLTSDEALHGVRAVMVDNDLNASAAWSAGVGNVYAILITPVGEERFDSSPMQVVRSGVPKGDYAIALRSDDGAAEVEYSYSLSVPGTTPEGVDGCAVKPNEPDEAAK